MDRIELRCELCKCYVVRNWFVCSFACSFAERMTGVVFAPCFSSRLPNGTSVGSSGSADLWDRVELIRAEQSSNSAVVLVLCVCDYESFVVFWL